MGIKKALMRNGHERLYAPQLAPSAGMLSFLKERKAPMEGSTGAFASVVQACERDE